MKSWYRIENAAAEEADVYVYNDIGMFGVSARDFAAALAEVTAPVVNLHINSYGGEVFDGFAMFNVIRAHEARFVAHVDGIAASIATVLTLACDEVRMAKNAMFMIHNPFVFAIGEAADLRKEADVLDKLRDRIAAIYVDRSGAELATVTGWMDDEKWFDADEAVANGFADAVDEESDDVPDEPQNKRGQYWNSKIVPRVRPTERVRELGLDELLPDTKPPASAGRKAAHMATANKKPAASVGSITKPPAARPTNAEGDPPVWPDAADVREGVKYGPTGDEYTGTLVVAEDSDGGDPDAADSAKNATVKEIKAEFADDKEFALERVEIDAPMVAHKAAYADHLKAKNKKLRDTNDELRNDLAKAKPGSAGRKPVDVAAPDDTSDAPKPMTDERRAELRRLARLKK